MKRTILALTALFFSGCALDPIAPRPSLEGLPAGLEATLAVDPSEVARHEPFTVRLTVTNTSDETIRVVTSHGCLVVPDIYRHGVRIPFRGSWWGCTAAITTHTFLPGETKTREWAMRAELYAEYEGDVDGAPAPRGTYSVQARFDTPPDGQGRHPTLETTLRVR